MKGKYLYGIIKRDTSRYPSGCREDDNPDLSLNGLTAVAYQSLAAVVEEKEIKDYRELPKEETIKELISHQQTIEKIMEYFTVLPVKFGTILKDEEEVKAVLEKGYFFLRNTLRRVEGKIELDLVCFWNEAKAAQMACQESSKVRGWQEKITTKENVTSEDKIALGKLVADYLAERREKLGDRILKTLKKEAVESCRHALADVNMLFNQAFLVEKEHEGAFSHTLNTLDSTLADLINFRLVGPLPPYSFATVVMDVLDKEKVGEAQNILEVDGEARGEEIKKAYAKLAFTAHPDHGGNPIEFERATKSYKLLKEFAKQGQVGVRLYQWEEH